MALESLFKWAPFRIDALGLITMIGAEEVDRAIGRLVENPWVDYLPFLGSYVIAGNRFAQPIPGATLYNVSDGIMATDMSGWMTRWLIKQDLSWNITAYVWASRQITGRGWQRHIQPLVVGVAFNAGLLVLTVLVRDWFGFTNTVALIVSVIVRRYMTEQNKAFLDNVAMSLKGAQAEFVKVFVVLMDGRAVTLFAPRGLVTNGFLTTPRLYQHLLYKSAMAVGWLSFGFHVICIGQATLFIQIITVVIMITATSLCCLGIRCNEYQIGARIHIHPVEINGLEDRRTVAYARLSLSEEEENAMLAWSLFPQRSNKQWWNNYRQAKASVPLEVESPLDHAL